MRLLLLIFLVAAFGPAIASTDVAEWNDVAAARGSRPVGGIEITNLDSDSIVALAGGDDATIVQESGPRGVISIDLSDLPNGSVHVVRPAKPNATEFPSTALLPDVHGRIAVGLSGQANRSEAIEIRNPWEVRIATKTIGKEILFECGGVVTGGEGGSVAMLNGHIVRRGDALDEFNVTSVLACGVILERNGSYLAIPLRRSTTVVFVGK